jgi:hypothetical protein
MPKKEKHTPRKLRATFDPQVWINDYAVSIDPKGPTTWDCTAFVKEEGLMEKVVEAIEKEGHWLDVDDVLVDDPRAPMWMKQHAADHPFTIIVEFA